MKRNTNYKSQNQSSHVFPEERMSVSFISPSILTSQLLLLPLEIANMRATTSSQSLLLLPLLLLLLLFFPFLVQAKFIIEPCDSSNSCQALLAYRLPFDSKLFEIASRFQTDVTQIVASNGLDPTDPLPGNQIVPENTVVRVPVSCPCVDGIRRSTSTVYTVKAIDTVNYIAVGFGGLVSADQIREANGLSDWDRIYLGQRLVIPLPCFCFNGSDNGITVVYMSYAVKEGENLKSIGRRYGTTVTDLVAVNGLGSSSVNTGDILAIPIPGKGLRFLTRSTNLIILGPG